MTPHLHRKLIEAVAGAVIRHADELTALDRAIGDGDHGLNMKRGFEAVLADLPKTVAQPLPAALNAVGMTLVMKVGGASGPLYGTLFMTLGKTLPAEPGLADVAQALDPNWNYAIVSLKYDPPRLRNFRIVAGEISETAVEHV